MDCSKCWACVRKFLALVWKFFIVNEDNIIYLTNDTIISILLKISGICLEISSMCLEIQFVHKDCAIFLSNDTKISRMLINSCVRPEVYGKCLKFSRFVQISGLCPEISSMCLETLIVQKYFICFPDFLKFLTCVRKF